MLSELHPDVTSAVAAALAEPSTSRDAPAWTETINLLLESTGDGIFCVDVHGRCTFMNRTGAETLGRSTKQVLGQADGSWFHTEYSSYPVFDAGVVLGAVVTFVDITERSSSELRSG